MKINLDEIRSILKSVDKEHGYFYIPLETEDIKNLDSFNGVFIAYTFIDNLLNLEYSETGLTFNLYADWCVDINNKGVFRGKGSVRHKEAINNAIMWFLRIVYDESLHQLLNYYPS